MRWYIWTMPAGEYANDANPCTSCSALTDAFTSAGNHASRTGDNNPIRAGHNIGTGHNISARVYSHAGLQFGCGCVVTSTGHAGSDDNNTDSGDCRA